MTLTFRHSFRSYQQSPATPDGALSAPLARITGADASADITDETTRRRVNFAAPITTQPLASLIGRLITMTSTPPTAGSSGTNKHDNWTFRIVAGDTSPGSVGWVELEGFRWEDAGTNINYVIHAAATFTAPSANFPVRDNSGVDRADSGPVEYQGIEFTNPTNAQLELSPLMVTARLSATTLMVSDTFDNIGSVPVEGSLSWRLVDYPIVTPEEIPVAIHRFLINTGWELWQWRGRNNGAAVGRRIVFDIIYRSTGESNDSQYFMRMMGVNQAALGAATTSSTVWGIDFALWSYWDRDYVNASSVLNRGNGVNALSSDNWSVNSFAAQADQPNTSTGQHPAWSPNYGRDTAPLCYDTPFFHGIRNNLATPLGGDRVNLSHVFFGDKDSVTLMIILPGQGFWPITLGQLADRPNSNNLRYTSNAPIAAGANAVIRLGGSVADPLSDGLDPENPGGANTPYRVNDRWQVIGQRVAGTVTANSSHSGEFMESAVITSFPGLQAAYQIFTFPAGSAMVAGQVVPLDDGFGQSETMEFTIGGGPAPGNVAVPITGAMTATQVRDAFDTAVQGTALDFTNTTIGADQLRITNNNVGGAGNTPIAHDVTAPGFALEGGVDRFLGGGYSVEVGTLSFSFGPYTLNGEEPQPLFITRVPEINSQANADADAFNISGAVRISNRADHSDPTYGDHNGPVLFNENGFDAFLALAGDLAVVSPNRKTGRFGVIALYIRDPDGGQQRGGPKWVHIASAKVGAYNLIKDRQGRFFFTAPGNDLPSSAVPWSPTRFLLALGPIPSPMAV